MKLDINEVSFESTSYADPNGRLFRWNGDIYRAISPEISTIYTSLIKEKKLDALFARGLIETDLSPLQLEGYGVILRHRKVPIVSYGFEWCGQMLKDAALLVLDLSLALSEMGYELHDANPWNVLFDGCVPYYVDFGSIVPISQNTNSWRCGEEFIKSFLNPLLLISQGKQAIARKMMADWRKWGVPEKDYVQLLPFTQKYFRKFLDLFSSVLSSERVATIRKLREIIERIEFKIAQNQWTEYYKEYVSIDKTADWTPKQTVASEVLSQLHPETVLDIGSNTGWFSELAMKEGCKVIALDEDEGCIHLLYERFKTGSQVLPLVMDFACPSEPHGRNSEFASATDRLRSELVFALGITHHLVINKGMNFRSIVDILSRFTKSVLLVEFVPKEDRYLSEWYNENYSWYDLDNFILELRGGGFLSINVLPSNRPPRSLLLCQRAKEQL